MALQMSINLVCKNSQFMAETMHGNSSPPHFIIGSQQLFINCIIYFGIALSPQSDYWWNCKNVSYKIKYIYRSFFSFGNSKDFQKIQARVFNSMHVCNWILNLAGIFKSLYGKLDTDKIKKKDKINSKKGVLGAEW